MPESVSHWQIILVTMAIQVGFGVLIAIIGFFTKRSVNQIDEGFKEIKISLKEELKKHDDKISGLEEKVHDIREELPQRFVMRDDYIRALAAFGNKLEKIHDAVTGLGERMASMEKKNDAKLPGNC